MTELVERHALIYEGLRVEIVIDTDGEVSVDLHDDNGNEVASFSWAQWSYLSAFAARAAEMSNGLDALGRISS